MSNNTWGAVYPGTGIIAEPMAGCVFTDDVCWWLASAESRDSRPHEYYFDAIITPDRYKAIIEEIGRYDLTIPLHKPLLPSPQQFTPGPQAWDEAMAAMAGLPNNAHLFRGSVFVNFEAGYLMICVDDGCPSVNYYFNDPRFEDAPPKNPEYAQFLGADYQARGRDWQKEGVLRAWLDEVKKVAQG